MDGWRKSTALMACTGDDEPHDEAREVLLLLLDVDVEDDRRIEVRRLLGEKRERIVWKCDVCIFCLVDGATGSFGLIWRDGV
jgi:hypothetical protein